jgi:hypothetical protein
LGHQWTVILSKKVGGAFAAAALAVFLLFVSQGF